MVVAEGVRAQADEKSETDETYTATARVAREQFDSTLSESKVEREQGDRAAAGEVGDRLELAEGVVVQRTSSASSAPILRGLTGNRVLLMQDQLRLNDSLTRPGGNALLNLVDPESVERVEVIRGPASVLYGSDALGGVVQLRTYESGARPGAAGEADATAYARGASAERSGRAQGAVRGLLGPFGARVSGGYGHAGEILRGGGLGEQPFTGYDAWSAAWRIDAAPDRRHRISLSCQSGHLLDVPRSDLSTAEDQRDTKQLDRDAAIVDYSGNFTELNHLRLRSYLGLSSRREWRQRRRSGEVENERDSVLGYHAGLNAAVGLSSLSSLDVGAETVLEDVGSGMEVVDANGAVTRERGRYVDDSRYNTYALYALFSYMLFDSWTALAGARGTLIDAQAPVDPLFEPDIGVERQLDRRMFGVVGSAGVRYDVSKTLSWTAGLLGGFRAPILEDFQALGGGARGYTIPNPDLDEERSWTLQTGMKWDERHWQLEAYLFGSLLTDLIERIPTEFMGLTEIDGERLQTPTNASRGVLLGTELSVSRRFDFGLRAGVAGFANWGVTERPDADGNQVSEPASKVPPPIGALLVGFDPRGTPYWSEARLTGALPQWRLSESDKNDVRICENGPEDCDQADGWVDITLRAGLRFDKTLLLSLGVENLLDSGYKSYASGAYAPGRNFTVALRGSTE
ncbi:MAG: TonB-dependent receptor [Deltaproteobacteria bacterium]|nr:TonB-dependent receptor [Deltaproteobacteria bacterium]